MPRLHFEIDIECENDSFRDNMNEQIATILLGVVDRLRDGHESGNVRDVNGSTVGRFRFVENSRGVIREL
jgi:hypothetical protein